MTLPDDIYLAAFSTLAWGMLHAIFSRAIKTVSERFVPNPVEEPSINSSQPVLKQSESSTTSSSPSKLRKRKDTTPSSSTTSTSVESDTSATTAAQKKKKHAISDRIKFEVASWKFTCAFLSSVIGAWVLWKEDWAVEPRLYFENWPNWDMGSWIRIYYAIGFGNYAYASISVFSDPKQSDFFAMLVHHVSTMLVIAVSYSIKMTRVGAVILLLHDCSDPFMEIAKCFLYCKRQNIADFLFLCFAAVFMYTRNYLFPVYVIASIPKHAHHEDGSVMPYGRSDLHYICLACLCVLEVLHIYWAFLIIKMIIKAVVDKRVEGDIRDEDDD